MWWKSFIVEIIDARFVCSNQKHRLTVHVRHYGWFQCRTSCTVESIESDIDMRTRAIGAIFKSWLSCERIYVSLYSLRCLYFFPQFIFFWFLYFPVHCIQVKILFQPGKKRNNLNNGLIGMLCDMKFICRDFYSQFIMFRLKVFSHSINKIEIERERKRRAR